MDKTGLQAVEIQIISEQDSIELGHRYDAFYKAKAALDVRKMEILQKYFPNVKDTEVRELVRDAAILYRRRTDGTRSDNQ